MPDEQLQLAAVVVDPLQRPLKLRLSPLERYPTWVNRGRLCPLRPWELWT